MHPKRQARKPLRRKGADDHAKKGGGQHQAFQGNVDHAGQFGEQAAQRRQNQRGGNTDDGSDKGNGKNTADYLTNVLNRITLPGAVFLAIVALLPEVLINYLNIPFRFGGTSILIAVGVALDTMRQLESQLTMRDYEGFLK